MAIVLSSEQLRFFNQAFPVKISNLQCIIDDLEKLNISVGSDISGGGTIGNIPKFTGAQAVGDSLMTDNGVLITITGAGGLVTQALKVTTGAGAGKVLTSDAAGQATWQAVTAGEITLTNTHILVGNAGNIGADVAMSGDATISNTGAVTIANNAITNAKIANTTIDLTAKVTGTLPVGNGGTGTSTAFTQGSVVFAGPSGIYAQDNANFFWNDATNHLGIGTNTALRTLEILGSKRSTGTTATLTGSIDPAASTAVVGVGTLFTTELVIGDRILVTGEIRTVTAIADDTNLTVDLAFLNNANDPAPTVLYALDIIRDSTSIVRFTMNNLGGATWNAAKPASVSSGNGTLASTIGGYKWTSADGGDTTDTGTRTGGTAGGWSFTGGSGGVATSALTSSTGGTGGSFTFIAGTSPANTTATSTLTRGGGGGGFLAFVAAGAAASGSTATSTGGNSGVITLSNLGTGGAATGTGTTNNGGAGGTWTWVLSGGGAATGAASGVNTGGVGGSWSVTTGNGGAANTAATTNNGGNGGNITFTAGRGGVGSTANGLDGIIRLIAAGVTAISIDGGGVTTFGAAVVYAAGTATVGTSPVKYVSGTLLATPEAGAVEFNGTNLFFTPGATRYQVATILTGSSTLDFGSTAAGASTDLTITVTGAVDGDPVSVGVPNGSTLANGVFTGWVSAADTVTVRFTNTNLVAALDPASGTFKVTVNKN